MLFPLGMTPLCFRSCCSHGTFCLHRSVKAFPNNTTMLSNFILAFQRQEQIMAFLSHTHGYNRLHLLLLFSAKLCPTLL